MLSHRSLLHCNYIYISYYVVFKGPSELEKEYLTSQIWGSLFTDDNPNSSSPNNAQKPMNTLWGYIIRKYSDIAVPTLDYLAGK